MARFQAKKDGPKALYLRAGIVVLLLVTVLLSKSVWDIYSKSRLARKNKEISLSKLAEIEGREAMLAAAVNKLKTSEGAEEEIRKNLSVIKEGEKLITIVDEPVATSSDTATTSKKWWQKALGL